MEKIAFSYTFYEDKDEYKVEMSDSKESMTLDEVCELFSKFVKASGYNSTNLSHYFEE